MAASKDDLEEQIDKVPTQERTRLVESIQNSDGMPDSVKGYGLGDTRQFLLGVWDECENRGLT